MSWHEFRGKSVREAIDTACESLGVEEAFLQIDVIQEGTKGFLGLVGHKEAHIRVRKRDILAEVMRAEPLPDARPAKPPAEARAADARTEAPPAKAPAEVRPAKAEPDRGPTYVNDDEEEFSDPVEAPPRVQAAHIDADSPRIQEAKTVLEDILGRMSMETEVIASTVDGAIYLDIKGDGSGLLIGKKGQTLDALQYLVSKIVNRDNAPTERVEVVVDTENYRIRKQETLRDIAARMSQRAMKTLRPVSLSPMPANERRIVHMILAEHREVYTKSYGEGPMRRIIIYPRRAVTNKRRRR